MAGDPLAVPRSGAKWFAEQLLDESPDTLIALTLEGRIQSWNRGAHDMFGYTAEEAVGRAIDDLTVPQEGRTEARHALDVVLTTGSTQIETIRRHKDGTLVHVRLSMRRVDARGGERFIAVSQKDVTPLKRLYELEASEAKFRSVLEAAPGAIVLKSEFLANMSHELRTPLNAIIGFAELMHLGKVGPVSAEHEEYLGDILTSSKHLLRLINDVLDLAKIESGKMEFRIESVDLVKLSREVCDILRGVAASKRLQMETHIDPDVATVIVDPARVKQILYNYLSNAIRFTPPGGRITIRILPEGQAMFRIDVEDTGVGIAADDLGKLFVEFQQLDAGVAKEYQGTGLGLTLTKKFAEAHGGRVAVRSTPGEGCTFSAVLPRVMVAAPGVKSATDAVDRRVDNSRTQCNRKAEL